MPLTCSQAIGASTNAVSSSAAQNAGKMRSVRRQKNRKIVDRPIRLLVIRKPLRKKNPPTAMPPKDCSSDHWVPRFLLP